jgi:hypothetical protein
MLHLPSCFLLPRLGVSSSRHWLGIHRLLLPLFSMLVKPGVARVPCGCAKRRREKDCRCGRSDVPSVWTSGR